MKGTRDRGQVFPFASQLKGSKPFLARKMNIVGVKRVSSIKGDQYIDVVQSKNGFYMLHYSIRKFDSEEQKSYVIRVRPDPAGKFGDIDTAVSEAERILN